MEDDYAVKREPNPLETAGLFSRITFMYTVPILLKGRKKQFTEDDIFKTLSRDKAQYLGDEAEKLWNKELKRCKESDKVPKLRNVLIGMQKFRLFKMVISQVTFLSYLISYYLDDIKSDKEIPYLYVGGFLLSSLCIILLLQKTLMRGLHTGIDMRITACCLIYRKTLRLNQSTIGETTSGHITNLLTNDASVFERGINQCGAILICPVQLIVFTIFLYLEVGPSSLIGISVFIIVIPLYGYLGKLAAKYRLKTAVQTDSRIWLMAEIIRGIEVIKMYAWEKSFAKLVAYHRKMEIKSLTKSSYIKGSFMNYFLYIALSLFITILSHYFLEIP
ncbi:hypothetical protein FQR65_LT02601 [Abscondita terminalis]|nr:hypothetical protein FQR65_LT02601 [Abscondita terminalis]